MKNEVKCYLLVPTEQKRFNEATGREEALWQRTDTGELVTVNEAPPGAIWDATWMPDEWKAPDGHYYIAKTPTGIHWAIDSRCGNCTKPNEKHQCWVRHGVAPELHVDKEGDTCEAGAGSIWVDKDGEWEWHGFLHHGWFCR